MCENGQNNPDSGIEFIEGSDSGLATVSSHRVGRMLSPSGGLETLNDRVLALDFSLRLSLALLMIVAVAAGSADRAVACPVPKGQQSPAASRSLTVAGQSVELMVTAASEHVIRVSAMPIQPDGSTLPVADDSIVMKRTWPEPLLRTRSLPSARDVDLAQLRLTVTPNPLTVTVADRHGRMVQQLTLSSTSGEVTFSLGGAPVFGLGEGGQQFDRRGGSYPLKGGQGLPDLDVIGARVPIPWLIGTAGWGLFFHLPFGGFNLRGESGRFEPRDPQSPLPLDVFVVVSPDPAEIMTEYANLTGYPHMPPLWALGYQQSHRTLSSPEEVLSEAKTFREKKLPCDVLIYLGTGFCPSGWNTGHGSFTFNARVFPDPAKIIEKLHQENFHLVLHVVNPPQGLRGTVNQPADPTDENAAANVWAKHLAVFRLGIDGWWPDEGDKLEVESRLARNRLYWEGPQLERPNQRPYALHRNGYAGMQRYAWLWSGDVDSTWKTLEAQVPVGINIGLSGEPFWGTDTGGFVTTPELTGELYVRWFQFSSFCPLFRSHGRTWKLRLPWGWNMGDAGPVELERYHSPAGLPDRKEFSNPDVEPICKKYLDLRYRLLPYLYSAVREAHDTGLPMMRALWLHYPGDPQAEERGDEYLWGRDILVAPVVEKGATFRRLYLPHGLWYDFWTEAKAEGGREITRPVDLATIPIYLRAGAIIPLGPVKQYTAEKTGEPLTVKIYPGANGRFVMYEDDGTTFDYEKGRFTRVRFEWNEHSRHFRVLLEPGSTLLPPSPRRINLQIVSGGPSRSVVFDGKPLDVAF
jgi:alpha-glucosidase (family GH31 glycosyl hydrolase)